MRFTTKPALCAVLSTAFLLGAAVPVLAQGNPLGGGGGSYFNTRLGETNRFAFTAVQLPNGAASGVVEFHFPSGDAMVQMRVTSFMYIGPWLGLAGPVTKAVNTRNPLVGLTGFIVLADNGGPGTDTHTGFSRVPPMFGNLTIQEIVALIGPPPPAAFYPVVEGNIQIH